MAIRQVKKEPEIPIAHLYMEDIEEMVGVLADVERTKRKQDGETTGENVECYFIVNDKECDSLEDLKKLGGKWRNFEARVGNSTFQVTPVSAGIYVSRENDGYERVFRILLAREMKLRTSLHALPGLLGFLLCILLDVVLHYIVPASKWAEVIRWSIFLSVVVFYVWESMAHTVVELRYSHEKTPRWKSIREAASKAIWMILGVILAELGRILWEYLTKHK